MGELARHLRRIHVSGYRSLRNVEVTLGRLNVLIGSNGAGKSNLVDAVRFVRDAAVSGAYRRALVKHRSAGERSSVRQYEEVDGIEVARAEGTNPLWARFVAPVESLSF